MKQKQKKIVHEGQNQSNWSLRNQFHIQELRDYKLANPNANWFAEKEYVMITVL
jgi:hypothetical protein